jgi:5-enolpyruvylshikimate-3-phosphate synthase
VNLQRSRLIVAVPSYRVNSSARFRVVMATWAHEDVERVSTARRIVARRPVGDALRSLDKFRRRTEAAGDDHRIPPHVNCVLKTMDRL